MNKSQMVDLAAFIDATTKVLLEDAIDAFDGDDKDARLVAFSKLAQFNVSIAAFLANSSITKLMKTQEQMQKCSQANIKVARLVEKKIEQLGRQDSQKDLEPETLRNPGRMN